MARSVSRRKVEARKGQFPIPKRAQTRFLVRHVLTSDTHEFVGRVYDLSIVSLHFDTYEALAAHPDCKYAIDVNEALTNLVTRVESLNLAGRMLWLKTPPKKFRSFPVSRYEWLMVTADVFLMRYISVVDCALILVNEVLELGLDRHDCTLANLRKKGLSARVDQILTEMVSDQGSLRIERNARVHHGAERAFTQDDTTFKLASLFEHRSGGITGMDRFGRKINLERMLKEALVPLQREFNRSTRVLARQLDKLYKELWRDFEIRFGPRIRASTHGLNASRAK